MDSRGARGGAEAGGCKRHRAREKPLCRHRSSLVDGSTQACFCGVAARFRSSYGALKCVGASECVVRLNVSLEGARRAGERARALAQSEGWWARKRRVASNAATTTSAPRRATRVPTRGPGAAERPACAAQLTGVSREIWRIQLETRLGCVNGRRGDEREPIREGGDAALSKHARRTRTRREISPTLFGTSAPTASPAPTMSATGRSS